MHIYEGINPKNALGTIQVLRQHVFGPPTYFSINGTVNQQKLPFSDPTHLLILTKFIISLYNS